ncbi:MAG: SoxR reducing system RseC family protein [Gallionella sp.]|nr:SoxR reducing system RseC family protein [Gallionella sp.]
MLETRARIIKIEGEKALIQAESGLGCEQCKGKGCGSSKLGQLFCSTPRQFKVENTIHAKLGDDVIVAVDEGVVLRGIGLVYVLPLLLMLVGALLGSVWANDAEQQDGYAVIGAILGLLAGFVLAKRISARLNQGYFQPYLTGLYRNEP